LYYIFYYHHVFIMLPLIIMSLKLDDIRAALLSDEIEGYWTGCLQEYDASEEERAGLLLWIRGVRDGFIAHVSDIDDPEEMLVSVALSYIEFKSQWQMLNTQINYQVFRTGDAKPHLMYKSSLLSVIVDTIGKLLTADDINKIQEFLLNPVADT
jgi:hypothetical protein